MNLFTNISMIIVSHNVIILNECLFKNYFFCTIDYNINWIFFKENWNKNKLRVYLTENHVSMVIIYLQTPMRRKLEIQFLTTLSTPLIRVAGLFGFSLCLLLFLSFHIANSVAWNTYRIRNKCVLCLVC